MNRQDLMTVLGGKRALEICGQRSEPRVRLRDRDTRLQPPSDHQRRIRPIEERAARLADRIERAERQPQLLHQQRGGAGEPFGRDADDGEVLRVEAECPADEGRIEAALLPHRIAGNRHRNVGARLSLVPRERASGCERDADRTEEVVGDALDADAPRHLGCRHADGREVVRDQLVEHVVSVADVGVVRIREDAIRIGLRRIVAVEPHELRGAARQRTEEQRVDQREHRAVDADAEREHGDHDEAEARLAPPHADRVPQVLRERIEERDAALLAVRLLDARDAAEIAERGPLRVRARQPASLMLVGEQIEMRAQLLVQFIVAASRGEYARQSRESQAESPPSFLHSPPGPTSTPTRLPRWGPRLVGAN